MEAEDCSLLLRWPVKVEVLGVQPIFGGIMGIRSAGVKLLPLHPVATATKANIVTHFPFFYYTPHNCLRILSGLYNIIEFGRTCHLLS